MKRVLLLAVAVTLAAAAEPAVGAGLPGLAPVTAQAVVAGKYQKVTLITGDVVEMTDAGAGKKAVSIQPAHGRERVAFRTLEVDGGLRVLPDDVVPYVSSGVLDASLFDVEELVADGYGDSSSGSLPLIIRTAGGTRLRAGLPGTTTTRTLDSIGASAVSASKVELPALWESLKPAKNTARTLTAGVTKVSLDGKVRASLDRSVPQIGAPAAWQAGFEGSGVRVAVLDTGVDANHPDLVGKVKEARDFSGSPSGTADHFGHGTHVAATVAGTGAGANGTRKGVAPKADLIIGKVLGDDGFGDESTIIAGMEWAAAEGARVVNLSLGGDPTDGTDPLSQALNDITARTGTLFVVAAGNSGEDRTIGAPGAAAAALTVGAVDRDDSLADFSSRGPRLGDDGLKPEITAPGVEIVAARAAGTALGHPIDELYTAVSGTSMATPHVAGAAALLAQAHPGWTAGQLKSALVSSSKPTRELSVYAQGAGRVDVARAVHQKVYATGVADFGLATGPSGRTITYTNDATAPVTLKLESSVKALGTTRRVTSGLTLPSEVTVPAGGSADVFLSLDPAAVGHGQLSGWIVATGPDGLTVRTAVGAVVAGPKHKITVRAVGLDGRPTEAPIVSLIGDDPRTDALAWIPEGLAWTAEVEEGTYLLYSTIDNNDPQDERVSLFTDPNVTVRKDTELVIDPRKAASIAIHTPKPSEQHGPISYYVHRQYANGRTISIGAMYFSSLRQLSVTPTKPVQDGSFEFSSRWQLIAPMVQTAVQGINGPLDVNLLQQSPTFEGKRRFPLVAAGPELKGVKGAIALIYSSFDGDGHGWGDIGEEAQIRAVADAGAAGVILIRPAFLSAWTSWDPTGDREPIPALVTTAKDGATLLGRAGSGHATIDLTLTPSSPYLYDVLQTSPGAIPARIDYHVTPSNSARIDTSYRDNGGFPWAKEQRFGWRPWQDYAWYDTQRFVRTPTVREEWVTAGGAIWQHRVHHLFTWEMLSPLTGGMASPPRSYGKGTSSESWFAPVVRPAAATGTASTRTGDRLSLRIPSFVDAAGHYTIGEATSSTAVLLRNGATVAQLPDGWQDVITSSGDAAYRLQLATERIDPDGEWNWGTKTQTVWEFRSASVPDDRTVALPLLQVDYDVPADSTGRVRARPHLIGLKVHQQEGAPAARPTTLQAEVSFDEGSTWRKVTTVGSQGRYVAVVPAGRGTVSLRIVAGDNAGDKITQTVIRAYGLK